MVTDNWYLLYCKPKQELRAQQHLINQGFSSFLPLISSVKVKAGKKVNVTEPLFPRYLFLNVSKELNLSTIRNTRGVCGLVQFGQTPAMVSNKLVQALLSRQLTLHQQYLVQHKMQQGDVVEILSGPFAQFNAVFEMADGENRSLVLLQFLGQSVHLAVDNTIIAKK